MKNALLTLVTMVLFSGIQAHAVIDINSLKACKKCSCAFKELNGRRSTMTLKGFGKTEQDCASQCSGAAKANFGSSERLDWQRSSCR